MLAGPAETVAEQPGNLAVRKLSVVTFARSALLDDFVPEQAEQRTIGAHAQPVRALTAHACGGGGRCDVAADGKGGEEIELALGRPAVAANAERSVHPQAWIMKGRV